MRRLTPREQVIAVATAVVVLFYFIYRLGLGETLTQLADERRTLAELRAQAEDNARLLRLYPSVAAQYERYGSYSLPRSTAQNPADEFTAYVAGVLRSLATRRFPNLRPTEEDDIEGVPNYKQILLPIETSMDLDALVDLLRTFDRERLLIRRLEISSPIDSGPEMDVKLTLSRFVRTAETPPEPTPFAATDDEAGPSPAAAPEMETTAPGPGAETEVGLP